MIFYVKPTQKHRMDQLLHKHLIGNVNSASKIKILSNLKPRETDAQKAERLYELRKDGRTCTYENPPKHNILVIKKRVLANDILATTSNKIS